MEGAAELVNPHSAETGDDDLKGFANVPAALLRCMIVHPIVGDIVKQEVLQWEMNPDKAKVGNYTGVAGMLGHMCMKKQDGTDEFFLSGHVSK